VEKVRLSEYQVGRLAVLEGLRVVPRQHTIIELCVAGAVGDVNVIWGWILIDRHVLREIETLAVDEVVKAYVEEDLTEHRSRGVARCQKRCAVLEYSIVSQVRGEHVARRVNRDAAGFAHTARRRGGAKIADKVFLPDNRISCRVDTRSHGRFEFKNPAILQIDYIKVGWITAVELDIDRCGQRPGGRAGETLIKAAGGEVGLAKNAIGGKYRGRRRTPGERCVELQHSVIEGVCNIYIAFVIHSDSAPTHEKPSPA
jgi:hypothetical protein